MTDERPAPFVPAEVDLRDYDFMPLHVVRLRDSDLVVYSTGDEFKAAVLLWSAAWHQVPAGSLPNDDKWLAKHSGAGLGWRKLRAGALRGWVECTDGRLHHEVTAEVANASWRKKQEQRAKTLKARIAALEKRLRESVTDSEKAHVQTMVRGLLHELSQINAPPVTRSVTDAKTDQREVKGSEGKLTNSKTTVEETPPPEAASAAATPMGDRSPGKSKAKTNGNAEWWATPEGVLAHGKERGIPARPRETNAEYKERLFRDEYPTTPIPFT